MLYLLGILGALIHSLLKVYNASKYRDWLEKFNWQRESIAFVLSCIVVSVIVLGNGPTSPFPVSKWNVVVYGFAAISILKNGLTTAGTKEERKPDVQLPEEKENNKRI